MKGMERDGRNLRGECPFLKGCGGEEVGGKMRQNFETVAHLIPFEAKFPANYLKERKWG